MSDTLDIKIREAEKHHIDDMAKIFAKSFHTDPAVKLMFGQSDILPTIQSVLNSYINVNNPSFQLAVDRNSKRIIGWISVGFKPAGGEMPDFARKELTTWAALRLLNRDTDVLRHSLASELEDQFLDGQSKNTGKERYTINALVTDPDYRCHGVAATLLREVVQRAMGKDLPIWVQTPSLHKDIFFKRGFQTIKEFTLDLREFDDEPAAKRNVPLGEVTWTQMKRVCSADTKEKQAQAAPGGAARP